MKPPRINYRIRPRINYRIRPRINYRARPRINYRARPRINYRTRPRINYRSVHASTTGASTHQLPERPCINYRAYMHRLPEHTRMGKHIIKLSFYRQTVFKCQCVRLFQWSASALFNTVSMR
jgi:hypothetical protein